MAWRTHTAHGTGTFKETWLELSVSQPLCLQTPPSPPPAHTLLTRGFSCHYISAESQAAGRRLKPLDHGLGTGNAITRSFCEFGNCPEACSFLLLLQTFEAHGPPHPVQRPQNHPAHMYACTETHNTHPPTSSLGNQPHRCPGILTNRSSSFLHRKGGRERIKRE